MIKTCQQCHKEYTAKPSEKLFYCSRVCSNKSRTGIPRPRQSELMRMEKNPRWTNNPSDKMDALHLWARRRKPKPKECEMCKIHPPVDLANISQEYKKDIDDFMWLCRACHIRQDGRIKNLKQYKGAI